MIKTIYKISISIICAILTSCVSTEVKIMGTLAGTVKDVNTNYPIKNCLVVNDVTSASLRTDANGCFNFGEVEAGEYTLTFSVLNYVSAKSSVIVEAGKEVRKDVLLQKIAVPTSFTEVPSGITHNSATLRGKIVNNGGSDIVAHGFMFGESEQNLTEIKIESTGTETSFEYNICDLKSNCEYYVMAYSTNAHGTGYGDLLSFETRDARATIKTLEATNVSWSEAILNGDLYVINADEIKEIGFYYGINQDSLVEKACAEFVGSSNFSVKITSLSEATKYYFQAYMITSELKIVGDILQFVTLKSSVPQIISQSVSKVYETTALLSAKGFTEEFDDNVEYGFYYGKSKSDLSDIVIVGVGEVGTFSTKLNGLSKNTKYYYLPFARNAKGMGKGQIQEFMTSDFNGMEYVDLGLPSGIKWARCNIGAETAFESGDKFQWAENIAKSEWGGTWRLPTMKDIEELAEYCSKANCSRTNVDNSKDEWAEWTGPNGNVIVFPVTGIYDRNNQKEWQYGIFWGAEVSNEGAIALKTRASKYYGWYPITYWAFVRPVSN